MIQPQNLTADLALRAMTEPEGEALVLPGRSISFSELDNLTWRAAAYLHDTGVRSGHVVATFLNDDLLVAVSTLALLRLGATVARLSSSATPSQIESQLSQARVEFVVADHAMQLNASPTIIPFDEALLPIADSRPPLATTFDAPAFLLFGSGSTGVPKVLVIPAQTVVARCQIGEKEPFYQADARVLMLSGLQFVVPLIRMLVLIHTGGTLILKNGQKLNLVRYCGDTRPTLIQGVVMHFEQMLGAIGATNSRLFPTLRAARVGSSTVSADLRERIRRHIAPIVSVAYATNECGVISELHDDGLRTIPPGSLGQPIDGVEVQIISPDGKVLGPGQIGMIKVRTPALISGYLDDPDATTARFRDGWFETGDLGSITPDGDLIYHGRADAMMNFNGINIYPAEIENCLRQLQDVKDLHVFALRHKVHHDVPGCALTLKPGSQLTEADILRFSRQHLGFKAPSLILILDELPRTTAGKLNGAEFMKLLQVEIQKRQKAESGDPAAPK